MANILGLVGYNRKYSAVNKLFAAFGNDIIDTSVGTGYGLNLTAGNKVSFLNFLDTVFLQNYSEIPKTYDPDLDRWTSRYVGRTLRSKFQYAFKSKIYLGNSQFSNPQMPLDINTNQLKFPSRVFYSDFYTGQSPFSSLTWGVAWGRNGKTTAGSPFFEVENTISGLPLVTDFVASNIKVGDVLFITNYNAATPQNPSTKGYLVQSIESPYRLVLDQPFLATTTGLNFWVGQNWFDVGSDDNDEVTGFGENSGRLIIFKLFSLWAYTGSSLGKVEDSLGTSSQRSVINKKTYTYYFHGSHPLVSGIYRYDGVSSTKISRAIDPFIEGMDTTNYSEVVAWEEGEELRFFLGDLTNNNDNISMTNAVATFNTVTNAWDVSPIADVITDSTTYIFTAANHERDTYLGTSDNQVLRAAYGYNFNGAPIPAKIETKAYYPAGSEVINEFPVIQIIGKRLAGMKASYRLWDNPDKIDDQATGLGELRADRNELELSSKHNQASGISIILEENGVLENDWLIEKITIFYKPISSRVKLKEG